MKFRKITSIVASLLLLAQMTFVSAENPTQNNDGINIESTVNEESNTNINIDIENFNNSIDAQSYVVIDSTTGEKIMGKNEDKVMYPASLTKIMTSLLLLESGKLNQMFPVSKEADAIGEASIYATEGEELSGKDLLYAMMLQSANDACYVVAEGVGGTAENFYKLMTERAKELGATSTNFTSANGLHEEDHVTTAMDLALITKEALKYEEFREVILAKTHTLTRTSEKGMKEITNKNRMLFSQKPEYNEYAIGGKTAFTTPAGNCLMEVAKKDGMEIIVISMKSGNIYADTNKIINYAFENFKSTPIIEKGDFVHEYNGTFMNLYTKEGVGIVAPISNGVSNENITTEVKISDIPSDVKKDSKVGVIKAYVNNELYKEVDIFSGQDYTFVTGTSFRFIRNIIIFALVLIMIKVGINVYKMRRAKTKGYLKNSRFY